jgi:hypothetical protein
VNSSARIGAAPSKNVSRVAPLSGVASGVCAYSRRRFRFNAAPHFTKTRFVNFTKISHEVSHSTLQLKVVL